MNRVAVIAADREYTLAMETDPPVGRRVWGVVELSLVDELTGNPVTAAATVRTDFPRLTPRAMASDGLVGLVGIPADAFPGLKTAPYEIDLTVTADGYITRQTTVTVPADPQFPNRFAQVRIADFKMRRPPVVISGRAVLVNGLIRTGLSGATIRVSGVWWTQAETTGTGQNPNLAAVEPPLAFDRAVPTGRLRRRDVTPVPADDKTLLVFARRGDTSLSLSESENLTGADLLWLDPDDPERTEFVPVGTLPPGAPSDRPAVIPLDFPLGRDHRPGTTVRRVTPGAVTGFSSPLDREAFAGDTTVFLNQTTGLANAVTVEMTGAPAPDELHRVRRYDVLTGPDGYFRLPPLGRVAQIEITATAPPLAPPPATTKITRVISPRYGTSENRVDFVFR